ncbi:hypothetical protein MBLNU459_g0879t1 [Dothideomycetes sp. NU459]
MAYREASSRGAGDDPQALSALRAEGREPGARRKKIAGYLRAANELRQSYTSTWAGNPNENEFSDEAPGAFPDAAVVRSGAEEMILFPSYARRHVKEKPRAQPGTIQQVPGTGRDSRDTTGSGDAEFWRQQWDKYEEDKAIVDVDVRGWLYAPHKGQMSRKHRLMVGLARQLVGIPAPSGRSSPTSSRPSSRSSSPSRPTRHEEEIVSQQAEEILRKGESEAEIAGRGGFSEPPSKDSDAGSLYDQSSNASPLPSPSRPSHDSSPAEHLSMTKINSSARNGSNDWISPVQKRSSWAAPGNMSAAELAVANANLMARLKPFMANPLGNTAISAFFYNDKVSRQRTVNTNSAGQFQLRAALDFVPTHVRVLASEKLSATEEVQITSSQGVSLISDIDDTIKHSAITSGAREIFRNAFIRDLGDLTIEGVKQWYNRLSDMGVKIHYVSNSPWQLYPLLTSFFKMSGLPAGSFHLKQYSGMLQGIFEPVAERKKATLDKILRDFPERKFILIGDSGEADLEVYTDVVMEHPGRVLGIFIRDVTSPPSKGFFDSSMGPLSGDRGPSRSSTRNRSTDSLSISKPFSRPDDIMDDDADLKAAIAASLKDMEAEADKDRKFIFTDQPRPAQFPGRDGRESRPRLPPRRPTEPPAPEASAMEENLIDFSDDDVPTEKSAPALSSRSTVSSGNILHKNFPRSASPSSLEPIAGSPSLQRTTSVPKSSTPPPPPPIKPQKFRAPSSETQLTIKDVSTLKPPPPKPRKPSTTVNTMAPSPLSQVQANSPTITRPPPLPKRQTYRAAAKQKLNDAYNALPSAPSYFASGSVPAQTRPIASSADEGRDFSAGPRTMSTATTKSLEELKAPSNRTAPPAPRRNLSSYPAAAAQYASDRLSWTDNNTTSNSSSDVNSGNTQAPINKKEELWKRRWARAKSIMEKEDVLLRTWRVGADVMDVCVDVVEKALREVQDHERDDLEAESEDGKRR